MPRAVALGLAGLGAIGFANLAGLVPPVVAGASEKAVAIPPSTTDVAPAPGGAVIVRAPVVRFVDTTWVRNTLRSRVMRPEMIAFNRSVTA